MFHVKHYQGGVIVANLLLGICVGILLMCLVEFYDDRKERRKYEKNNNRK